jgi:proton-translocating NADH-quinone oxidoreductase chain L
VDYAWLAPVACAGAFFVNVILWRQLGRARHLFAALTSVAAILACFAIFVVVFQDAAAHLTSGGGGHGATTTTTASSGAHGGSTTEGHLLFDHVPWFNIGGSRGYNFWLTMSVDWLSIMMLGVVSFLASLIQIYAVGYMKGDNRFWWFFSVMSLFCASMFTLVLAYDFLLLYMAWELVGLCSFLLIGFWYHERDNAEAAKKAFITTRVGDVGFFIGIALLFLNTGSFRMDEVFAAVQSGRVDPAIVTAAGILVFMGAIGKSGQFPLHVWLPDAMAGPTPVSALVHSATMVAAGVYLVGRAYPLFEASPVTMGFIATIGTITAIFAATIALTQREIKKVLAYSTVSQLGYMIAALGVGAYTAGLFHLFTHAFFKALLFLGAGSMIHAMEAVYGHHDKRANDIFNMGGLRKRMPITFWTFLLASMSLAGVPPFAGFFSKDEILLGAVDSGNWLVFAVLLIVAFLTAFYMFRAIFIAFFGPERWRVVAATTTGTHEVQEADVHREGQGEHAEHAAGGAHDPLATAHGVHDEHTAGHGGHGTPHESPWIMALPLLIVCIPAVLSGFMNFPGANFFGFHIPSNTLFGDAVYFGEPHHEELNWGVAFAGTLAGLLGIGLAAVMYWRPVLTPVAISSSLPAAYRTLFNKYYFDEAYQWIIDRIILGVSGLAATFDRKVINDRVIDAPGHLTVAAGDKVRYLETGRVYHYAFAFVVGIILIGLVMAAFPNLQFNLW